MNELERPPPPVAWKPRTMVQVADLARWTALGWIADFELPGGMRLPGLCVMVEWTGDGFAPWPEETP